MTKLSSVDGFKDTSFGLLKFGRREHLESLQQGTLYMNNALHFIEQEKMEGKKGMGDEYEATFVLNVLEIQFLNPVTDEVIATGTAEKLLLSLGNLHDSHLFCAVVLDSEMFEVINDSDDLVEAKLVFTEEQKQRFLQDFGDHVLIIPAAQFLNRVKTVFTERDYTCRGRKVQYDDFSVNNQQRLKAFQDPTAESDVFFWKDASLSYQHEFRIVVLNEGLPSPLIVDLGDMSDFTTIMPATDLLNGGYILRTNKS